MKGTLKTILIAFLAGVIGAFFYQRFLFQPDSQFLKQSASGSAENPARFVNHNEPEDKHQAAQLDLPNAENIDFVTASKMSTPCVVYIKTVTESRYASSWFDYFFGEGAVGQTISSGSGVIYSHDGYIVTNNHVIEDSDNIQITIGKKTYDAEVIGTDPSTDLAVLKIDAENLPNIKIGQSKEVQVGDWVLAVGNPFNLTSTVTAGIVSAKGRELNILKSAFPLESFIQTDAAINPGNSGGALVNLNGELIGINSAILSKTGSYAGYGFAIPSDIVKKIVDDIIQYGMVQKAFFGGDVLDIDSDIAKKLNLNNYNGVVLSYLQHEGAAEQAGLQKGDVILEINGEKVESRTEFEELISYYSPGDRLNVEFKHDNKVKNTTAVLQNSEGTTELLKREIYSSRSLGADFEKISKVEKDMLNIEEGVRIVKIRNGFIKKMGLEEGFIICYINKIPVKTPEELTEIIEKIRGRVYVEGVNKRGQWETHRYYF